MVPEPSSRTIGWKSGPSCAGSAISASMAVRVRRVRSISSVRLTPSTFGTLGRRLESTGGGCRPDWENRSLHQTTSATLRQCGRSGAPACGSQSRLRVVQLTRRRAGHPSAAACGGLRLPGLDGSRQPDGRGLVARPDPRRTRHLPRPCRPGVRALQRLQARGARSEHRHGRRQAGCPDSDRTSRTGWGAGLPAAPGAVGRCLSRADGPAPRQAEASAGRSSCGESARSHGLEHGRSCGRASR